MDTQGKAWGRAQCSHASPGCTLPASPRVHQPGSFLNSELLGFYGGFITRHNWLITGHWQLIWPLTPLPSPEGMWKWGTLKIPTLITWLGLLATSPLAWVGLKVINRRHLCSFPYHSEITRFLEALCQTEGWKPNIHRVCEVAQSCPTLCNPVDYSLPSSSVHGILQARILEWVAISFSRGSSQPRNRTWVSCIAGRRFILWATKIYVTYGKSQYHKNNPEGRDLKQPKGAPWWYSWNGKQAPAGGVPRCPASPCAEEGSKSH